MFLAIKTDINDKWHQNETNQIGHESSKTQVVKCRIRRTVVKKEFWMFSSSYKFDHKIYFKSLRKEHHKFEKKSENRGKCLQFKRNAKADNFYQKINFYRVTITIIVVMVTKLRTSTQMIKTKKN